eukprot:g3384.t1
MSYVYPFWRRQNQDRIQKETERTESTPSPDVDATKSVNLPPSNEFELKEIPYYEAENGPELETLSLQEEACKEVDQEQVFEDLTLSCPTLLRSRRISLENPEIDRLREDKSFDGVLTSAESSKKGEEISDDADLIDEDLAESETSSTDSDEGFDHIQSLLPSFTSVLYSKDHVAMFPHKKAKLVGRLSVIKQHSVVFLTWVPSNNGNSTPCKGDGSSYSIPPTPLSEISSITRHTPTIGWHYIIIVLTSGCSFPPLYFNNGGVRSLLSTLKQNANLVRAMNDPNTYVVNESPDPLKRSLHSMDLDDVFLGCLADNDEDFNGNVFSNTISRFKKMALDTTSNLFGADSTLENNGIYIDGHETELSISHGQDISPPKQQSSMDDDDSSPTQISGANISPNKDESLSLKRSLWTEVGSFEVLDGLAARPTHRFDDLKKRVDWGKEITVEEFNSFFDNEGRMIKSAQFRERAFYGGLSTECRKLGWKYLFGLWKEDWTREMCKKASRDKKRQYNAIRVQWENITPDQERRFAKWRDRKTRIDKDVRRTDRCQQFYKHEHGEQLKALKRILLSYGMYNFDLSYCQGMSDLASPILYIMMTGIDHQHSAELKMAEAEAFWCFSGLMDRVEGNFNTDQRGMHSQLLALEKLLQLLDPQLYAHFKLHDCLNFFFCFRWVLILFKREFSFIDILRLWESFFSGHKTPHFHLYVCIAVLVTHRKTILQEDMDFDTLLKFCLELSGNIDLMPMLQLASVLSAWGEPIEKDCLADIF